MSFAIDCMKIENPRKILYSQRKKILHGIDLQKQENFELKFVKHK